MAQKTFEICSKLELFGLKILIPNLIGKNISKLMLNDREGAVSLGLCLLVLNCVQSLGNYNHGRR